MHMKRFRGWSVQGGVRTRESAWVGPGPDRGRVGVPVYLGILFYTACHMDTRLCPALPVESYHCSLESVPQRRV